jgi:hypothetical protein
VKEEDNGVVFRCEATNNVGGPLDEEKKLIVEFGSSKVTVEGPEKGEVGEVLTFQCNTGNSNPASSLSWVVDSRNVSANHTVTEEADNGGFVTKSNITVAITNSSRSHTVVCFAHNEVQENSFGSHTVTVVYPPDSLIVSGYRPGDQLLETQPRSSVKVKCTVWTGNPLPKLVWFREGKKVEEQENTKELDEAKQKISVSSEITVVVERGENGKKYECKAQIDGKKKKYYDDLTKVVKLNIFFMPTAVDIKVTPEKLVENKIANLTCSSKLSNPAVDIKWYYNKKPLLEDGNSTKTEDDGFISSSFKLLTLTTDHVDGTVQCGARNSHLNRSVLGSIDLDVEYSPQFTALPDQPVVVEEAGNTTFTVSAKANPTNITFRWKKEGGAEVPREGDAYSRCTCLAWHLAMPQVVSYGQQPQSEVSQKGG